MQERIDSDKSSYIIVRNSIFTFASVWQSTHQSLSSHNGCIRDKSEMNEAEHEQIQDDSHAVITDMPGLEKDAEGKAISFPRLLRLPFRRQLSPRQRALQLTVIITVVVTLLVILGSSAAVRDTIGRGIFGPTPTPTATLFPDDDLFYIQRSPSWGSVSIDGYTLSHLPTIGVDPPLQLARGRHELVWHADPFRPQRCFVSVPSNSTDTCLHNSYVQVNLDLSAWVIRFSLDLNMLPDRQRTALTQATQAALDTLQSTGMVQPGEQYVDMSSSHSMNTAVRPLYATVHFQLDTNLTAQASCVAQGTGQACVFQGVDCRLFCPVPSQAETPSPSENSWGVFAAMRPIWDYATLDGKVVASNQPDSMAGDNMKNEYLVKLYITWDSIEWHVTVPHGNTPHVTLPRDNTTMFSIGDPVCASALDDIVSLGGYYSATGGFEPVDLRFDSGPKSADGCLVVETPHKDSPISSSFPVIFLFHRFGIILAANDAAHRYLPFLPLADTYEQKLAQQLATWPTSQSA
jgi:hypothetical protein